MVFFFASFFTKAQEVVLTRDFGGGSVVLERKTDNQSFRQNRDGSRFYKTTFAIKANLGNQKWNKEMTDIYSDNGTAMKPCMLIDEANKLLYVFVLSKSDEQMYGMDGIVFRLDLNSGNWTRENVFSKSNMGWYAYFGDLVNGNPELWHFSYAGYRSMCSTRNNNGGWSNTDKGGQNPDQAANQCSKHDNALVIKKQAQVEKQYDFSAVCSSGQTLYYKILDNSDKNRLQIQNIANAVKVTCPYSEYRKSSISSYWVWGYKGYTKPTGNVVVPSTVMNNGITYTIAKIGSYAFSGDDGSGSCDGLESITIPNTVVSIGWKAFKGCRKLKSVVIPNSVKEIESQAFSYCDALKSITIPNSVKKIGHNAFAYSGLKSIKFPDAMKEIHPSDNCQCVRCEDLESVVLPADLQVIPASMFESCHNLRTITIPNSVKKIENCAFLNCISLSVKVPNTVTYVGDNVSADFNRVFENCLNVIYYGKLKGAPWGAKCLNGYVEGDCVYKDKTKKTLVYCKPSENANVAKKSGNSGNSASKASERETERSQEPSVNENNIMNYVKSPMKTEEYNGDTYYYVDFKASKGMRRTQGTLRYTSSGYWEYCSQGHCTYGITTEFISSRPNTKLGALVNLYKRLHDPTHR